MGEQSQRPDALDFERLVEENSGYVYSLAFRILGNAADAEDATQDAFLSAHGSLHKFRGESSVRTWLYRIATNAALTKLRRERRQYLTETGYSDMEIDSWPSTSTEAPDQSVVNEELRERVEEGLSRLPPQLRAIVALRDMEELTNQEAAEVPGISVASLKSRLHRGRVLLRKHLDVYLAGTR